MRNKIVTAGITWLKPLEVGMTYRTSDPDDCMGSDLMRITKIISDFNNPMDSLIYHKNVEHPRRKEQSSRAWWVYGHCQLESEAKR